MRSVMVLARDQSTAAGVCSHLEGKCVLYDATGTLADGLAALRRRMPEVLFLDVSVVCNAAEHGRDVGTFRTLLTPFWQVRPSLQIVVMSPTESLHDAIQIVRAGAGAYILLPVIPEELHFALHSLSETLQTKLELDYLRGHFWRADSMNIINTASPLMQRIYDRIRAAAPTRVAILLTGETGAGKGIMARLIHHHSERRDKPFISVHCGAIPETLLESELFGHEKGSFTGATRRKLGKFQVAHGGTMLLDEIGSIPLSMQVKLLQVLQDKTIQMIGSESVIEVDTRIIAATNEDLSRRRREGAFREDLYFRLNVLSIEIPPLRQRREDIPLLIEVFITRFNRQYGREITGVHPLVMEAFMEYPWPGNIRELENLLERACVLEKGDLLTPESFPSELFGGAANAENRVTPLAMDRPLALVRSQAIEQTERQYLTQLLKKCNGSSSDAAKTAGVTQRQLYRLLKQHRLHCGDFTPDAIHRQETEPGLSEG